MDLVDSHHCQVESSGSGAGCGCGRWKRVSAAEREEPRVSCPWGVRLRRIGTTAKACDSEAEERAAALGKLGSVDWGLG